MASLSTEIPPIHTAEGMAGVTTPAASQSISGVGPGTTPAANNSAIDSTQSVKTEIINNTASSNSSQSNSNNTISAAADSSDNQPGTPQPHLPNANEGPQNSTLPHQLYANHSIYANTQSALATAGSNTNLNQMYPQHIYSQTNMDLQQPHAQHSSYSSYLNSYEQFYQQQQQQQLQNPTHSSSQIQSQPPQMDFINSNSNPSYLASDYKQQVALRYQPYLHTPTSGIPSMNLQNSNSNNTLDPNSASSSLMSPRVVSSTSPSSTSNQMQINGSATSSMSGGNPNSPNSAGSTQCKKCCLMFTNDTELQEHITNVHGTSPYGSSGYASSPYIKDEMQERTPPAQTQQPTTQSSNPGGILDLDSQKMLYPSAAGSIATIMNQSLGNNDPLHGLHNMQQRAGINSWNQQAQEGQQAYLQQQQAIPESNHNLPSHSPFYQSPKQSPYHVSNSSNVVKTEYQPIIKNEYGEGDAQQFINEKSFDPTVANQQHQQQQQMMAPAVSSSPAEFPSTTTGGQENNGHTNMVGNQQFRTGNFEPPSSSSATLSTGPLGSKAANWKSNEARRPKTYNCSACIKWFTSSGHLKRHYNTTLHKNAVKSSGLPDPATQPISMHHHPARDPSGKTGRRGAAAAAAATATAANGNKQQQQQPLHPVQPPEPPNSPQNYGVSQMAAGGLTPIPHYAGATSPNSMYQQQQYQEQQYLPQVQSTSNTSPQHASSMASHHLQQQQLQQQQHETQNQQTILNGHPNALAGLSVPPTRQQTPMPSSQMRGLLTTTMPPSPVATVHIIKNEQLEAAVMEEPMDPDEEVEPDMGYIMTAEVKEEMQEVDYNMYSSKDGMEEEEEEQLQQQESQLVLQHLPLQEAEEQAAGDLREVVLNVEHHHNTFQLQAHNQFQQFQLEQQRPEDIMSNITHSNTQLLSPLIISHHQYQGQPQHQHQMVDMYTITEIPSSPQQLLHNLTEPRYINIPLDTNMQQPHNNTLQLQQPLITTGQQQLPPATTIRTTNMVNMLQLSRHHMQQPQQQHMALQQLVNMQPQLDTISTNTPSPHITPTNSINTMASYHQLQRPGSVLPPLEPMLNYPNPITGNTGIFALDLNSNLLPSSKYLQQQQITQTTDGGELLPKIVSAVTIPATSSGFSRKSVREASPMSPMVQYYAEDSYSPPQNSLHSPGMECKPSVSENYLNNNNYNTELQQQQQQQQQRQQTNLKTTKTKNSSTSSKTTSNKRKSEANDEYVCNSCVRTFGAQCYLSQHNLSIHSGKRPYRCNACGKEFKTEDSCKIHEQKHKDTNKPHKCEFCTCTYHYKTDLKRHIESLHSNTKKHVCDHCGKGFCRRDHLRKHIETHNRPRTQTNRKNSKTLKNKKNSNRSRTLSSTSSNSSCSTAASTTANVPVPSKEIYCKVKIKVDKPLDCINYPTPSTTPSPSLAIQQLGEVSSPDSKYNSGAYDDAQYWEKKAVLQCSQPLQSQIQLNSY